MSALEEKNSLSQELEKVRKMLDDIQAEKARETICNNDKGRQVIVMMKRETIYSNDKGRQIIVRINRGGNL
jgi:hypothetical protein